MSSAVEVEDKTLKSNSKQTATDGARKPAEQAGTAHGLPKPESTLNPDTARLKADKARREAEAAKASNTTTPDSPSGADAAGITTDNGKDSAKPSQIVPSTEESLDGTSNEGQKKYTDEQKNTAYRVL